MYGGSIDNSRSSKLATLCVCKHVFCWKVLNCMMDVDSEELERRTEDKMADTSHTNTTPSLNTSLSPSSAPSAVKDGSVYQLCSSPSKIAIHKSPNASLLLLSNYGGSDSEESSMEEGEDETNNEGLGNSVHNLSFGIVQANNISNTETDVLLKENTKSNDTLEGNAQISTNRDNNDQGNKLSQSSLVNEVASQMSNSNNTGSEVPVTFEGNNESSQTINLQGDKSKNIDDNAKNSEVPLEITCVGMKLDVKGGYRQLVTVDSESEDSESDSESSISSPSTSSSESESSSECEEISIDPNSPGQKVVRNVSDGSQKKEGHKFKKRLPRTPGELTLDELPPIEDLKISVPEELTQPIGSVFSIVEQQVVVAGYPNVPPIDLDSVLFVERGSRSLGQVFDVFGPVQTPFYVVRFNSSQHVIEAKIQCGDLVYFAPTTDHTNFVLLHELMRIRGSDASGMQGNEVLQVEEQDFSDDEEENRANLGKNNAVYSSSTDEFQSRPKRGRGHSGRGFHSHRENYNPFLGPREPRPSFAEPGRGDSVHVRSDAFDTDFAFKQSLNSKAGILNQ
ncbi:hypothetical protein Pmani_025715 [Petrolisthes manimaculis]|uniref:H/ACA ribonucleoprotein complex non-core subunit NAF1 n=1 Tax=Petrolisthes manimaculis TaxID=1843537 RepID=A0AAE1TYN6_9EUCA|nr:hypothetical protein Pmani_025715 [Petrolisthes manimaculis]